MCYGVCSVLFHLPYQSRDICTSNRTTNTPVTAGVIAQVRRQEQALSLITIIIIIPVLHIALFR